MSSYFHVNGLPKVRHTEETKKIFDKIEGNKSEFQRDKTLEFAKIHGFDNWQNSNGNRPEFVSIKTWEKYCILIEGAQRKIKKAKDKKKVKVVDYTYIIAYDWLKSLDKFQYVNDATLQRLIICG